MDDIKKKIRKATEKEINFYKTKLYPLQDIILNINTDNEFYLTGGTALSRFYFNHRFSDDLDFFFDGYKFPEENFNINYRKFLNNIENEFQNIDITIDSKYFKRLFINKDKVLLKIEFMFENFKTVGEKLKFKNLLIDSKDNICANKIGTIINRQALKDFVDLFFLLKDINIVEAIKNSEYKNVPPNYEGLIIGFSDIIKNPYLLEGQVLLSEEINYKEFIEFIKKTINNLMNYAKAKKSK